MDISAFTFAGGKVPTYTTLDMLDYNIQGYTSIRLFWDHDTDDEIAILPAGSGTIHFSAVGGKTDPRTTGGTGDIILTTAGHTSGATYDITLFVRPKV